MLNLNQYRTNTDGNVAMMFSMCALMLLGGIGVAIDYTNVTKHQNALQAQVDAAVLAAARVEARGGNNGGGTDTEEEVRRNAALKVIEANGFDMSNPTPVMTMSSTSVTLQAEMTYKPMFGSIIGMESLKINAVAESGLGAMEGVEIVLVLDNTDSMGVDNKMDALKVGATSLIDAIESSSSDTKIALVPFSRYVRVPDSAATESWFEMPAEFDTPRTWQQATYTGGSCADETRTRDRDGVEETYVTNICTGQTTTYETINDVFESRWDNCIGTRLPPFSEQDGSYNHKIPGLLNRIPHQASALNFDRNAYCPAQIEPLTDNYDSLRRKINGLWSTDETHIPTGLIWGQRVLSPGLPYNNVQTGGAKRQIMVLMTDGKNTAEIQLGPDEETELDAPPYIGSVNDDEIASLANATTSRLCTNLKNDNIEIYTIAFQVTDPATKTMLRNCASAPNKAFTPNSNAALIAEFRKISKSLKSEVRLMR